MSPTTFAYIDYMQGDLPLSPELCATLRLNKTPVWTCSWWGIEWHMQVAGQIMDRA